MDYPILIAECGNNHMGNIDTAFEMIEQAKSSGADLVKFQAGTAEGFARTPDKIDFYKQFELGLEGYKKLIAHGLKNEIDVFFSIWSPEMEELRKLESWHKIPARQCNLDNIVKYDSNTTLVSIPYTRANGLPSKIKGYVLHVIEEYPTYNPMLHRIMSLNSAWKDIKVGYSDHTIGISTAITAIKEYGAKVVEKHFTLRDLRRTSAFRDHIHSATPNEFRILSEATKYG